MKTKTVSSRDGKTATEPQRDKDKYKTADTKRPRNKDGDTKVKP